MVDIPINGDKYIRTLSHYLRSNQRRLLPPTLNSTPENPTSKLSSSPVSSATAANARSFVTPADPMAAAYQSMVNSLWNATTAVVDSITPASFSSSSSSSGNTNTINNRENINEKEYNGTSWDGIDSLLSEKNPSETHLHSQAQLRSPIFPLDLYYLLYLLDRFEEVGIDLDGWEVSTRTTGDSKPHVIFPAKNGQTNPNQRTTNNGNRPQSIRSFSSTAVSTLTLITGWKQWSTAASYNSTNLTVTDDIHFVRKFLKHVPGLRLVSKIAQIPSGKGRIEGFDANAILTLMNHGRSIESEEGENHSNPQELHNIPPDCVEGWEALMKQLKSLVIVKSEIEDIHHVLVTVVVNSERRRRQKAHLENTRAGHLKEEQQEALKDAALVTQELGEIKDDSTITANDSSSSNNNNNNNINNNHSNGSSKNGDSSNNPNSTKDDDGDDDEEEGDDIFILSSLRMWPVLRHLSFSDNSLTEMKRNNSFSYAQSVTSLDLSHNMFVSPPSGLIYLHNLNELDLSFNMINGVQHIYQVLGNITSLNLRGNRLESLSGIERLWNLEKVDVRENHLDEAAEVGRLAALPCIREVWSERNPFCTIQPNYRVEILAVFKANGHDLLLDGTFASYLEKRDISKSLSTTITSINNVANIPAASAPVAAFSKELSAGYKNHSRNQSVADEVLNATTKTSSGSGPNSPITKLTKKKLVKANKRAKRVVNLDSDHEEGYDAAPVPEDMDIRDPDGSFDEEVAAVTSKAAYDGVLGSPVTVAAKKKKKKTKEGKGTLSKAATKKSKSESPPAEMNGGNHGHQDHSKEGEENPNGEPQKARKRLVRKKSTGLGNVSFAGDKENELHQPLPQRQQQHDTDEDHSLCRDGHHVHRHRLAVLEDSLAALHLEKPSAHQRQPSKGILKRNSTMPIQSASTTITHNNSIVGHAIPSGAISPRLRPSSPIGSFSSDDGADGYRRKIEAIRKEAGRNWLMVFAEMHTEPNKLDDSDH
ncbi:hypothetical protein BGZ76_005762 [Entomortierella beljakovae]|nr:hypothetical protein BGZ76_005762 [Entomortierella beljakovae]